MANDSIDITEEISQNFIDFSYEANSQRAFADARDGLKPGQRACLWEMYEKGYSSKKPHVKSAKIDGGVAANWWPHGTTAIYETFARMSQSWINNIPEVDWHGANGSIIISGEPAADRYTEARLSKAAEEGLLQGIKKNNVPMIKNFTEDAEWPSVLPALMPRLMINGCQGIGVTIANVWLPHCLTELTPIIIKYIEQGSIDYNNIAPSFPTGGVIINKNHLADIYKTGKGTVILRAKTEIKDNKILITELPYQVYVEPLIDQIKELVKSEKVDGINDILNKSDKKRLLIEITCSINPNIVLQKLFKNSDLQKSYSANQWALVGKTPKLLTLKEYLNIYINHNKQCIKNEFNYDYQKAKNKLEIDEGLSKALEDIDNIITLIKTSNSSTDAKTQLINKYNFTENQAKAIIDMKLGRLAHLEKVQLNEDIAQLKGTIKDCLQIIENESEQQKIFIQRLTDFTKKYGDKRRTELTQIDAKPEEREIAEVVPEEVVVVVTQNGDIKRIPKTAFKTQRKNGKGVKTIDEAVFETISTNTIDTLMVFTNKGKMYRLVVDKIPVGTNSSKGQLLSTLINMDADEHVAAVTSLHRQTNAEYVLFFTKQGLVKKTKLEEYINTKKATGIQAIKIKDGDEIANVTFVKDEELLVVTKHGYAIHFTSSDIAPIGRVAAGVKSIKLELEDEVIVGLPINPNTHKDLAIFSKNGLSKKTSISEYPVQGRAGRGILTYKPNAQTGEVVAAVLVNDNNNLLLFGTPSSICISASDIPELSRVGSGNIMIKNSKINKVVKL